MAHRPKVLIIPKKLAGALKNHVTSIDMNNFNVYLCDMKLSSPPKRAYTMTVRADQMARNERNILAAMVDLWLTAPIQEITLEHVAEKAGVTVRTILRKYGSKEGLMEACIKSDAVQVARTLHVPEPGNIPEILEILLNEYELMGPAVIRTIAMEEQFPFARKLLERGRFEHRRWCAEVFRPFLLGPHSEAYEIKLAAFIAATEIYLWKLLRKDLGQSREQTQRVFRMLLDGLVTQ